MPKIKSLTTGQVAEYSCVSQATIVNWIKNGKLKAYTTPGGHHRILLSDFLSFLELYKMPVDPTLAAPSRPRVLIVGENPHTTKLVQTLQGNNLFDVMLASNDYEASARVARLKPDAVVLDMTDSTLDRLALCRWLRTSEQDEISVLVVGNPENEADAKAAGTDAYLPSTAVVEKLEEELELLLGLKTRR
jgi:excisionase family DNA binding protein